MESPPSKSLGSKRHPLTLTGFLCQLHGNGPDVVRLKATTAADVVDACLESLSRVFIAVQSSQGARFCEYKKAVAVFKVVAWWQLLFHYELNKRP